MKGDACSKKHCEDIGPNSLWPKLCDIKHELCSKNKKANICLNIRELFEKHKFVLKVITLFRKANSSIYINGKRQFLEKMISGKERK